MTTLFLSTEQHEAFTRDGFLIIPDFISGSFADELRAEMHRLVDGFDADHHRNLFCCGDNQGDNFDTYFRDSSDGIGFFLERKAVDSKGDLVVDKHHALNKVGHALHRLNPVFQRLSFDSRVQAIARDLEFQDPRICQSMYIFKQPKIGDLVNEHQDNTYLWSDPNPKVIGYWVALEDATVENGCLWFAPGSHREGLRGDRHFFKVNADDENSKLEFTAPLSQLNEDAFQSTPVKKGTLVLIDGFVVHRSGANTSEKSRHIYTWHVVEHKDRIWSKRNWLQSKTSFDELFKPENVKT